MRCVYEISVGAYVLDALEPAEQLRMQQHVQECPICAEAVRELEELPRLLAAVPTPGEAPEAPVPSEMAFERFRRSAVAVSGSRARQRRLRRWLTAAAAAVLVLIGAAGAATFLALNDPQPTVVEAWDTGVWGQASYVSANDGTKVSIELDGLPVGAHCRLFAVSREGLEEAVGGWTIDNTGTNHWSGWVSFEPSEVDEWIVRAGDGRTLLTLPV